MDFTVLFAHPLGMVGAVVGLIAVKGLILYLLASRFGVTGAQGLGLAVALAQGGEFAFVLLQLIGGLRIIDADTQKFLVFLVALSIAATPPLTTLYARFVLPRFMSQLPERDYDAIDEQNPVIIAGFGRVGQIVGRFLSGQGVAVTILEKNPDQVELVRKFGQKSYFGDATRLDLLHSAGAATARMLVVAVDDADAAVEIVRLSKLHFPKLKVFARARNRRHAYDLHKAGVDYYHRETLDSSLAIAREAMVALGRDRKEVEDKAQRFLAHDIRTLKASFAFFENEPEMINFSKLSREELEGILREDRQDGEAAE
jgi:CPA2 family monovalent cation:H+ antiporter-2/glutathione-regulated potassium-efflux system ancillary protein KefC